MIPKMLDREDVWFDSLVKDRRWGFGWKDNGLISATKGYLWRSSHAIETCYVHAIQAGEVREA